MEPEMEEETDYDLPSKRVSEFRAENMRNWSRREYFDFKERQGRFAHSIMSAGCQTLLGRMLNWIDEGTEIFDESATGESDSGEEIAKVYNCRTHVPSEYIRLSLYDAAEDRTNIVEKTGMYDDLFPYNKLPSVELPRELEMPLCNEAIIEVKSYPEESLLSNWYDIDWEEYLSSSYHYALMQDLSDIPFPNTSERPTKESKSSKHAELTFGVPMWIHKDSMNKILKKQNYKDVGRTEKRTLDVLPQNEFQGPRTLYYPVPVFTPNTFQWNTLWCPIPITRQFLKDVWYETGNMSQELLREDLILKGHNERFVERVNRYVPRRAFIYDEREKKLIMFANTFLQKFMQYRPTHCRQLLMLVKNEYDCVKHICTFIRPAVIDIDGFDTWKGCSRFIINKFEFLPINHSQEPPKQLNSSYRTLKIGKGNIFELTLLLESLLLGAGYDVYVVCGYVKRVRADGLMIDSSPDPKDLEPPAITRLEKIDKLLKNLVQDENYTPPKISKFFKFDESYFDCERCLLEHCNKEFWKKRVFSGSYKDIRHLFLKDYFEMYDPRNIAHVEKKMNKKKKDIKEDIPEEFDSLTELKPYMEFDQIDKVDLQLFLNEDGGDSKHRKLTDILYMLQLQKKRAEEAMETKVESDPMDDLLKHLYKILKMWKHLEGTVYSVDEYKDVWAEFDQFEPLNLYEKYKKKNAVAVKEKKKEENDKNMQKEYFEEFYSNIHKKELKCIRKKYVEPPEEVPLQASDDLDEVSLSPQEVEKLLHQSTPKESPSKGTFKSRQSGRTKSSTKMVRLVAPIFRKIDFSSVSIQGIKELSPDQEARIELLNKIRMLVEHFPQGKQWMLHVNRIKRMIEEMYPIKSEKVISTELDAESPTIPEHIIDEIKDKLIEKGCVPDNDTIYKYLKDNVENINFEKKKKENPKETEKYKMIEREIEVVESFLSREEKEELQRRKIYQDYIDLGWEKGIIKPNNQPAVIRTKSKRRKCPASSDITSSSVIEELSGRSLSVSSNLNSKEPSEVLSSKGIDSTLSEPPTTVSIIFPTSNTSKSTKIMTKLQPVYTKKDSKESVNVDNPLTKEPEANALENVEEKEEHFEISEICLKKYLKRGLLGAMRAWILVKADGDRVKEDFFLDTQSGMPYLKTNPNFVRIDCVFNDRKYYIPKKRYHNPNYTRRFVFSDKRIWHTVINAPPTVIQEKTKDAMNKNPRYSEWKMLLPMPWVPKLKICKDGISDYMEKEFYDSPKRRYFYKKSIITVYERGSRDDGLRKEIFEYDDMKYTKLTSAKFIYKGRNDHLVYKHYNVKNKSGYERFEVGRDDGLKTYKFNMDMKNYYDDQVAYFYPDHSRIHQLQIMKVKNDGLELIFSRELHKGLANCFFEYGELDSKGVPSLTRLTANFEDDNIYTDINKAFHPDEKSLLAIDINPRYNEIYTMYIEDNPKANKNLPPIFQSDIPDPKVVQRKKIDVPWDEKFARAQRWNKLMNDEKRILRRIYQDNDIEKCSKQLVDLINTGETRLFENGQFTIPKQTDYERRRYRERSEEVTKMLMGLLMKAEKVIKSIQLRRMWKDVEDLEAVKLVHEAREKEKSDFKNFLPLCKIKGPLKKTMWDVELKDPKKLLKSVIADTFPKMYESDIRNINWNHEGGHKVSKLDSYHSKVLKKYKRDFEVLWKTMQVKPTNITLDKGAHVQEDNELSDGAKRMSNFPKKIIKCMNIPGDMTLTPKAFKKEYGRRLAKFGLLPGITEELNVQYVETPFYRGPELTRLPNHIKHELLELPMRLNMWQTRILEAQLDGNVNEMLKDYDHSNAVIQTQKLFEMTRKIIEEKSFYKTCSNKREMDNQSRLIMKRFLKEWGKVSNCDETLLEFRGNPPPRKALPDQGYDKDKVEWQKMFNKIGEHTLLQALDLK